MRIRSLTPARASSASLSSECTLKGSRWRSYSHSLRDQAAPRGGTHAASAGGICTNMSSLLRRRKRAGGGAGLPDVPRVARGRLFDALRDERLERRAGQRAERARVAQAAPTVFLQRRVQQLAAPGWLLCPARRSRAGCCRAATPRRRETDTGSADPDSSLPRGKGLGRGRPRTPGGVDEAIRSDPRDADSAGSHSERCPGDSSAAPAKSGPGAAVADPGNTWGGRQHQLHRLGGSPGPRASATALCEAPPQRWPLGCRQPPGRRAAGRGPRLDRLREYLGVKAPPPRCRRTPRPDPPVRSRG